ncbi:MAG: hypothetical protein ACXACU_09035 [Candidatus Hodarchaeales archaeon]
MFNQKKVTQLVKTTLDSNISLSSNERDKFRTQKRTLAYKNNHEESYTANRTKFLQFRLSRFF